MFANIMAATAFNSPGLGYAHAPAHQIGGFYDTNHGNNMAVLLPHVMEYNTPSISEERIGKMGQVIDIRKGLQPFPYFPVGESYCGQLCHLNFQTAHGLYSISEEREA